jgi:hypothetical protein
VQPFPASGDTFDGFDLGAFHLHDGNEAAVDQLAIDQHGTRAALSFTATLFGARQLQLLSQHIEQSCQRVSAKRLVLAVDDALHGNFVSNLRHSRLPSPASMIQASTECD